MTSKYPKTRYPSILPILDEQHAEIFHCIDKLYAACKKHWYTEHILQKIGRRNMPKNHIDTTDIWNDHELEHIQVLENLTMMKKNIMKHIREQDVPHFKHWSETESAIVTKNWFIQK